MKAVDVKGCASMKPLHTKGLIYYLYIYVQENCVFFKIYIFHDTS